MLRKVSVFALLFAALVLALGVGANANPGEKSGGTSMLLSGLLLPGSGQMYCGETGRGLAILGAEVVLLGVMVGSTETDYYGNETTSGAGTVAAVGFLGLHIWQIIDANKAADRANAKLAISPVKTKRQRFLDLNQRRELPSLTFDVNLFRKSAMVKKTFRF